MSEIANLGYLGFSVSDLERWEELAVSLLGLQVSVRDAGKSLALRMDDMEQRIVLTKADRDEFDYAGWLFDTEEDLDGFCAKLRDKGIALVAEPQEIAAKRRVERVFSCVDPNGLVHEFAFAPQFSPNAFRSSALRGNFVAGKLGLGHILVVARDYRETVDFARNVLGLRLSDYIRAPLETPGGVIEVDATFMHTRTGRHHSLATAQIPVPARIHHLMIEVDTMDDVGLAYERCLAADFPIAMTLGHHPNDQMFSFYVRTPSGFMIEFGWGGRVIDDAAWEVKTYAQLSDWGHAHH